MDSTPAPENTVDKSKFIRTFAKDVASLGQIVPKEFTPAAPKKEKIAAPKKIKIEKKKPLEEVLPAQVKTPSQEDPSFVPVAPALQASTAPKKSFSFPKGKTPERKSLNILASEPKPENIPVPAAPTPPAPQPSPLPFSVPFPAPMQPREMPPLPRPVVTEELSPIHTYKTDFAEHIDTKKASTFSVLADQLDASGTPAPKTQIKEKVAFPVLPVVLGALLLIAGAGGVWFAYTSTQQGTPVVPAFSVPTLVFADDRKELTGPDFSASLKTALADPLNEGKIRILYSATASSTAQGILHIPNDGTVLINALNLQAPALLLRNIDAVSTTGMIHMNEETSPFFVLRASSYERTFSAMLTWEPRMATDLAWIYPASTAPAASVATSTAATTSPTRVPPPPAVFIPTFSDKVVGNYNMRVLLDARGNSILCYGYKDKQTLIIARSPEVFTAIAGRLVETK